MVVVVATTLLSLCSPSPAVPEDCDAADVNIQKKWKTELITTTDTEERGGSVAVFVRRGGGDDFRGVQLDVCGRDGTHHAAWFRVGRHCFPKREKWMELKAWVRLHSDNASVSLGFDAGSCVWGCKQVNPPPSLVNLTIQAHGTSKWIIDAPPKECDITYLSTSTQPSTLPACEEPPSRSSSLRLIIITAVLFFVSFGSVVGILYCKFYVGK